MDNESSHLEKNSENSKKPDQLRGTETSTELLSQILVELRKQGESREDEYKTACLPIIISLAALTVSIYEGEMKFFAGCVMIVLIIISVLFWMITTSRLYKNWKKTRYSE